MLGLLAFFLATVTLGTLAAQNERSIVVRAESQLGHSKTVTSVAFSPNGKMILSASWDQTIKLWDATTGRALRTFGGHTNAVNAVAFSPDGRLIASASGDKSVRIWDVATGVQLHAFLAHAEMVNAVAISPNNHQILSGGDDGFVRLWDLPTGELLFEVFGHKQGVKAVAFSADGGQFLSGGGDNAVRLWDSNSKNNSKTFSGRAGHADWVSSVAFAPDGRTLASGSYDKTIKVWDPKTGKLLRSLDGHSDWVTSIAFAPNGIRLVSGGKDKTLRLWDLASGQIQKIEQDLGAIGSVAFSSDGHLILSGGGLGGAKGDGSYLKLWDAETGKLVETFAGRAKSVTSVAFSSDGNWVVAGSADWTAKLWNARTGQLACLFKGHLDGVTSIAFAPDAHRIASGSRDGEIAVWDISKCGLVRKWKAHSAIVATVAFSPDGHSLLSGGGVPFRKADNSLKLWNVATSRLIRSFDGHSEGVTSVAFAPDGASFISGSYDGTLKFWSVALDGPALTRKTVDAVFGVAFSGDGKKWASGGYMRSLYLWDAVSGKPIISGTAHQSHVNAVAFSPDGLSLLSGGQDNTMKIWDAVTGKILRNLEGHSGWVTSVKFSPSGRLALSGSEDGTMRLWSVATGEELLRLQADEDGNAIAITPDGFFVATGDPNKLVHVVRGQEVILIDQLRDALELSYLVKARLSSNALVHATYRKAAAELDLERILKSGIPPEVELIRREPVKGGVRITVRVFNNVPTLDDINGGIGTMLKWRVDGVLQGEIKPKELSTSVPRSHPITVSQTLLLDRSRDKGQVITVNAYNGRNLLSSRSLTFPVSRGEALPPDARRPRMWIVGIGVNGYSDVGLKPLKFAVKDVTELADALRRTATAGGFDVPELILLSDEKATKIKIIEQFEKLAKDDIQGQDALIILLAGHGKSDGKCYHYLPFGASFVSGQSLASEAVGCGELERLISNVQAGKKAIFIDTCESGDAAGIIRAAGEDAARQSTFDRIVNQSGFGIFTAARNAAREDAGLGSGHGVLTFAVLNAIAKSSHVVDLNSIKVFVEEQVPELTKAWYQEEQKPIIKLRENFIIGPPQGGVAPTTMSAQICEAGKYRVIGGADLALHVDARRESRLLEDKLPAAQLFQVCGRSRGFALVFIKQKRMGWVEEGAILRSQE